MVFRTNELRRWIHGSKAAPVVSDINGLDDREDRRFTPSGSMYETVEVTVKGVTVAVTVTCPSSNRVWAPKEAPVASI